MSEHTNSGIQRFRDVFYMLNSILFQRTDFRYFEEQIFGRVGITIIGNVLQICPVAVDLQDVC